MPFPPSMCSMPPTGKKKNLISNLLLFTTDWLQLLGFPLRFARSLSNHAWHRLNQGDYKASGCIIFLGAWWRGDGGEAGRKGLYSKKKYKKIPTLDKTSFCRYIYKSLGGFLLHLGNSSFFFFLNTPLWTISLNFNGRVCACSLY